jgi:cobalt-zinc-cadmium efflux system protein
VSLSLVAAVLSTRAGTDTRTWGFRRAEVLAAAAQAAVLLAVGVFIVVEAVRRRVDPGEIASTALIVFGLVGLVGNIVSIGILAGVRAPT